MARRRTALRAGRQADVGIGRLAVPASRPGTVSGQAAVVLLVARCGLCTSAQLDLGVPAAVVAGGDGYALADVRPGSTAVVASRRFVGGGRGAGVGAVRLPGQARADRSDRG